MKMEISFGDGFICYRFCLGGCEKGMQKRERTDVKSGRREQREWGTATMNNNP